MTISAPTYESSNEFNAALAQEISLFLCQAGIAARESINSATGASNPITPITSTVTFGIAAAGGAQRNFTLTTSVTELDTATPNVGVITD
jgi:hypothetical protein